MRMSAVREEMAGLIVKNIDLQERIEALEKHKRLQMEDVMNLGAQLGQACLRIEQLEAEVERWHRVAMEAGAITCSDGRHIYPRRERIEQLEAALRLTRPYVETHTLSPNGTMATVLAKIDTALAPEQDK
jgi:predicted RNase H-like nuclease (RuvC/YqgF family)